jgi:hypothetical protein
MAALDRPERAREAVVKVPTDSPMAMLAESRLAAQVEMVEMVEPVDLRAVPVV